MMIARSPSVRGALLAAVLLLVGAAHAPAQPRPTTADISRASQAAEKLRTEYKYAEAIKGFQEVIRLAKQVYGNGHWQVAAYSMDLGMAYAADEQYDKAEPILRDSFAVLYRAWDNGRGDVGHTILASVLSKYADYNTSVGQLGKAVLQFDDALTLYKASVPDKDITAAAHGNFARALRRVGKLQEALEHAEASLAHRRKYHAPEPRDYAVYWYSRATVADILHDMGQYEAAERIYRERVEWSEKKFGRTASSDLWQLAKGTLQLGKFQESDQLITRSTRQTAESWPKDSHLVADKQVWHAPVKAYLGEWDAAVDLAHKSLPVHREHRLRIAAGVTDSEQLTYMQEFTGKTLSDSLSIGFARRDDPAVVAKSAEWVLNVKNLQFELLAERALLTRDGRFPEVGKAAEDLRMARRALVNHLNVGPSSGKDTAWRDRRDELLALEEHLSRELARVGGHLRSSPKWVALADIRKTIPAGEVVIEIKKFDARDFSDKGGPKGLKVESRYAAWVIPAAGAGEVTLVDLGSATEVEALVRRLVAQCSDVDKPREEFNGALTKLQAEKLPDAEFEKRLLELRRKQGAAEGELEKQFQETAVALSKRVLHPLLAHTGKAESWIISPDADLWLVPWAGLVLEDGKYVVDRLTLRQMVSGRDLLAEAGPKAASPPLVVANPNYSLGITGPETRRTRQTPLAAFESAAKAVRPYWEAIAQAKPDEFFGDGATEEVMKKARGPRVLLVGTHGTFEKVDPKEVRPGWAHPDENPFLRCQLVFAGCDRKPRAGDAGEDGTLYGLEVLGCDFRGTELVVLAACQSAEGDVHAGQAAVGMRSAFLLAGARRVEATLWSVDVRRTAILTAEWFKRMGDRRPEAVALVESQRAVRKGMVEERGSAHPFYWAAYTITVRGR